jgi:large subunit ribosomal protein L9
MEVILLEKMGKLGKLGDKVKVKAGYGRNYLLPFGKAVAATEINLAEFEVRRAELEATASDKQTVAESRAAALAELSIAIEAQAGEGGKLFGSVGPRDVADAIIAAGVEVGKSEVRMPEGPIREVGDYQIVIHLHTDVEASVALSVIAV